MKYRHLSHIDIPVQYQFITFRTQDSVDSFLDKLSSEQLPNDQKQLKIDDYLDHSNRGAYLKDKVLTFLYEYFLENDGELYDLVTFCIMPNHVHLLLRPRLGLADMMRRIKGASSKSINNILGRTGIFWARDYYDKGIRDHRHFDTTYRYIQNNPLKLREDEVSISRFYSIYEVQKEA